MGLVSNNIVISNLQIQPNIKEFISSQSIITSSTNFVTTTSLPPATIEGDLMFAVYAQQQFGGGVNYWTPPAAWTELVDVGNPISGISVRVVQPGDSSFIWTAGITSPISFLQLSFRNVDIDAIGSVSALANNNGTITVPSITTTVNNTIILLFIISSEAFRAPSTPTGFTLRAQTVSEQASASRPSVFVYMREEAGQGTTGTVTTNFNDFLGGHIGIQFALKYSVYSGGGGGGVDGGGGDGGGGGVDGGGGDGGGDGGG